MNKEIFFPFYFFLLLSSPVSGQNTFYTLNAIQEIQINFTQPNWDYQMDTAKNGQDGYTIASQVIVNGITFDSVGIKYKGYSSYSISQIKNPLHIELNHIKSNQSYQGFTDIKLSNGWSDPSSIREVLSYKILGNYMHAPKANFARVFINGNYVGLYSNTESINKRFLDDHFYSSGNTFVKCNPWIAGSYFSNLVYLGSDSSLYFHHYELKSAISWKELIDLCDTLANNPTAIQKILDVDRCLWMLAFNNVTVNLDSYSGAFAQNYYLYKDDHGRFNPMLWDMNMNFGGFNLTGTGGPLNIVGMQNLPPLLHSTDSLWPLIKQLLADTTNRHMYIAHMRTITNEFFTTNAYQSDIINMRSLIDSSVQADPNGLYSYAQFQQSLTTNIAGGFSVTPGIYNLMTARTTYLQNTIEFQQIPPIISGLNTFPSNPVFQDIIWITCSVSNAQSVQLGYRYYRPSVFNRIQMFDDGNHQDGSSGDGIYGVGIPALSAVMQYYIYAENSDAGTFSPTRAEYEFYSLSVTIPTVQAGDVFINEFMAINQNGPTDFTGKHEDWIEFFNNTNATLSLSGLYLSDDPGNMAKWVFPENAIIPAKGYAVVWADEDHSPVEPHCNFKLSGAGESIILSDANGVVLDSITYGQQNADVSFARCPDGTGNFGFAFSPTFYASNNCSNGIDETTLFHSTCLLFPNPASGKLNVLTDFGISNLELFTIQGSLVTQKISDKRSTESLDISNLQTGIYFLRINKTLIKKIVVY